MKRKFLPFLLAGICCLRSAGPAFSQGVQIEKATPAEQKPTPPPVTVAAEAIYDFIQAHHIEVAKYQAGTRYIWTDRLLIEIAEGPPPGTLGALLAAGPNNTSQFSTWVHDTFETQVKAWKPAKRNPNPREGTDELVAEAGGNHCFVNPIYLNYVLARYPKANILIKGPTEPALFTVNGQVKAVLSTWTQLPDGTPLL